MVASSRNRAAPTPRRHSPIQTTERSHRPSGVVPATIVSMRLTSLVTTLSLTATLCPLPALAQLPPHRVYPRSRRHSRIRSLRIRNKTPSAYPQQYAAAVCSAAESFGVSAAVRSAAVSAAAVSAIRSSRSLSCDQTTPPRRCSWSVRWRHPDGLGSASPLSVPLRCLVSVPDSVRCSIDPSGLYQIRGLRMNASSSFCDSADPAADTGCRCGAQGPRAGGIVLTTFGGIVTVLGITFRGHWNRPSKRKLRRAGGPEQQQRIPGRRWNHAGIGTAMLAGGITMIVLSRTTVRISGGSRLARHSRCRELPLPPMELILGTNQGRLRSCHARLAANWQLFRRAKQKHSSVFHRLSQKEPSYFVWEVFRVQRRLRPSNITPIHRIILADHAGDLAGDSDGKRLRFAL